MKTPFEEVMEARGKGMPAADEVVVAVVVMSGYLFRELWSA